MGCLGCARTSDNEQAYGSCRLPQAVEKLSRQGDCGGFGTLEGKIASEDRAGHLRKFKPLLGGRIVVEKNAIGTAIDVVEQKISRKVAPKSPLELDDNAVTDYSGLVNKAVHGSLSWFASGCGFLLIKLLH